VRLGTRGSRLALAQAESVRNQLQAIDPERRFEIVVIRTSGDKGDRNRLGAFVGEIQEAVARHQVDVAIHCLKDLPTHRGRGVMLSAYLEREDARDVLLSRYGGLTALPPDSVVGTGSVRRTSQLAMIRPDLRFRPLVGNVDTRLRKLLEGEYDAIVLAWAGLWRLGLFENWAQSEYGALCYEVFGNEVMLPAPGQAVLVLETREEDRIARGLVARLNHGPSERAARAERAFLAKFGAGCSVPVAAYAEETDGQLTLEGLVSRPDGSDAIRGRGVGTAADPEAVGLRLAEKLGREGAYDILRNLRPGGRE